MAAERIDPPSKVGTGMTLLAGDTGAGYALGSGIAGRLADTVGGSGGHTPAFAVTVTAAAVALIVTTAFRGRLARAQRGPATTTVALRR